MSQQESLKRSLDDNIAFRKGKEEADRLAKDIERLNSRLIPRWEPVTLSAFLARQKRGALTFAIHLSPCRVPSRFDRRPGSTDAPFARTLPFQGCAKG